MELWVGSSGSDNPNNYHYQANMQKAHIPGVEPGGGNIIVSLVLLGRLQKRITEVEITLVFSNGKQCLTMESENNIKM